MAVLGKLYYDKARGNDAHERSVTPAPNLPVKLTFAGIRNVFIFAFTTYGNFLLKIFFNFLKTGVVVWTGIKLIELINLIKNELRYFKIFIEQQ